MNKQETIERVVQEFEEKYGAFQFTCPETDTISKPQIEKYTNWLTTTLSTIIDEAEVRGAREERKKVNEVINIKYRELQIKRKNLSKGTTPSTRILNGKMRLLEELSQTLSPQEPTSNN